MIEFAAESHPGNRYQHNEDSLGWLEDAGVWLVADGMGGHDAGDYASRSVVNALSTLPESKSLGSMVESVRTQLQTVNTHLADEARKRQVQLIGSTAVVLLAFEQHAVVVWAGDSRAYRYRSADLEQLTRDHSQVQELVIQGRITPEQAVHYPGSNIITRAVGVAHELRLDSEMFEVQEGDHFLLCSDGLYNEVSDEEIEEALAVGDCKYSCDLLIERALARGARDNVTVVVIRALDEEQITRTQINPSVPTGVPADDDDPTALK